MAAAGCTNRTSSVRSSHVDVVWLEWQLLLYRVEMCPAHFTFPLLHSALCASDWSSLTPTVAHCICSLAMSVSATCTVGKTNRTPNRLCMSFHVSTDQLERALHMFRACSFLSHVLSLCEPGQLEESRVWPWAARLSEQGLLLELARFRPICLQLTATLLKFPPHSGMFTSLSMSVCRIVCTCMLPYTVSTMHACCSSVVELLTSHGHLCLAHHTTIQVRSFAVCVFHHLSLLFIQCQMFLGTATPFGVPLSALLEKV